MIGLRSKLHIYGALRGYRAGPAARFHMPGHKGRRLPCARAPFDITELPFSGCLEDASGVIGRAQEDVAQLLGAAFAEILTDGSTAGVYGMIYAAGRAGARKVILPRNAHKSAYNACAVLGIEPVALANPAQGGAFLPPTAAQFAAALDAEGEGCAVLVTSPDYFGVCADLPALRKLCDEKGALLLADGAHGAFMRFDTAAAGKYAGRFADLWVDGSHKTMPTLTQGALLCGRDRRLHGHVREALDRFRTTSPSYPIMASVEYGVKFMAERGAALCARVRADLAKAREILLNAGIACLPSDTLVLAPDLGTAGLYPHEMAAALRAQGIWAELETDRHIVFYNSPLTPRGALARLAKRMAKLEERLPRSAALPAGPAACTERAASYLEALHAPCEWVPFAEAVGRVCARSAGVTPPCYPVALAGERIGEEAARALEGAAHTFGTEGGKIAVLCTEQA